jgi:hypothetical protein
MSRGSHRRLRTIRLVTGPSQRRLRAAALLAAGSFALHQLRFLLGYGEQSHGELARQGHAYLTLLAPLLAVGLVLVLANFCAALVVARPPASPTPAPSLRRVWAVATGCLLAAYCAQETLEGLLSAGHPAGVLGVAGHGGLLAAPLAGVIGLVVALGLRGADGAIELAAEPAVRIAPPRPVMALGGAALAHPPLVRGIARHLGGRSPPPHSIP